MKLGSTVDLGLWHLLVERVMSRLWVSPPSGLKDNL